MPPTRKPIGSSFEDDRYVKQMLKDKEEHNKAFVKRMHNMNNEYYEQNKRIEEKMKILNSMQANNTKEPLNNIDIEKSTNIRDKIIDLIKYIESSIN
jgi:hypothetical protein